MNCTYCDSELVIDKVYYDGILICKGNVGLRHHYEKVDDGKLIKFYIIDNTGKYKFIEKYAFYNGREPKYVKNFAIMKDFSEFKNKTIEEIEFLYNKLKGI